MNTAPAPPKPAAPGVYGPRSDTNDRHGAAQNDFVEDTALDNDLPFGVKVDTYAEDTVKLLSHERDRWKAEAAQIRKEHNDLQRKLCRTAKTDVDLPAEMVRRLERLENDVDRYQDENKDLRDRVKAAETEVTMLQDHIVSQNNRLKGAGKKVRNAKDVSGKQEEKAKDAVREKQDRVSSERKMKQKCDKALAEAASLTKLCDDLQTDLDVERAGRPHLRKGESASDTAVAVVPIELTVHRAHFLALTETLEISQASVTLQMQDWYDRWKKPQSPRQQVVGANYADDDKESTRLAVNLDKLFGDLVEHGHQMTGAEHDGCRSKQSLENICRTAEARHATFGTM